MKRFTLGQVQRNATSGNCQSRVRPSSWLVRAGLASALIAGATSGIFAQTTVVPLQPHERRMLGIFPTYSTIAATADYVKPLEPSEKWKLAVAKTFDPASFVFAGVSAGFGQAENRFPTFGQGPAGFGRRYGAAFANQTAGFYLTEAAFPTLLHQDPRYFRLGRGTVLHRVGYAVGRLAITRSDAGVRQVNYSELFGTAAAAGISNTWNPADERTAGKNFQRFGIQLATDGLFNILREFLPDIRHRN